MKRYRWSGVWPVQYLNCDEMLKVRYHLFLFEVGRVHDDIRLKELFHINSVPSSNQVVTAATGGIIVM